MNVKRFVELAKDSNVFHKGEIADIDHIAGLLSPERPLLYWTMEFYDKDENDIKGGGGLGILAADTRRTAQQLGLPLVVTAVILGGFIISSLSAPAGFYQKNRPAADGVDRRGPGQNRPFSQDMK